MWGLLMACVCSTCGGKGYYREIIGGGTKTLTSACYACNGTGGWDEGESKPTAWSQALIDAAERRKSGAGQ